MHIRYYISLLVSECKPENTAIVQDELTVVAEMRCCDEHILATICAIFRGVVRILFLILVARGDRSLLYQ